jgi:hypothetical protein
MRGTRSNTTAAGCIARFAANPMLGSSRIRGNDASLNKQRVFASR